MRSSPALNKRRKTRKSTSRKVNCVKMNEKSEEKPDINFVYNDTDNHAHEIAEFYSYCEHLEFHLNRRVFEEQMEEYSQSSCWKGFSEIERKSVIMRLSNQLEVSDKTIRMQAARCILYIAQGCWAELRSLSEQQQWARKNVMLLYDMEIFSAFINLLNMEIENGAAANAKSKEKCQVLTVDMRDLKLILSVLYTITEVMRYEKTLSSSRYKAQVDSFVSEISVLENENLVVNLLEMVTCFCNGTTPHFPMKQILLLLWKLILISLGGKDALKNLKAEKRKKAGLAPQDEDTMEIAKTIRPSSPPMGTCDFFDMLRLKYEAMSEFPEANRNHNDKNKSKVEDRKQEIHRFPWKVKTHQKDIDLFLKDARTKYIGSNIESDCDDLTGLPPPIQESYKVFKKHLYTPLSELQIQAEETVTQDLLLNKKEEIETTPAELLYQAMLPNFSQYIIALLKVILAAAPTPKTDEEIDNLIDFAGEQSIRMLQSAILKIEVNRHKEITIKAASAILLLLLKHFKLNHIYQFEYTGQHLVFANCIPLILKFLNQNIVNYIETKNKILQLDFPECVIGGPPQLTTENVMNGDPRASCSWRNMFSCINLLRILNKLTKHKYSRIMMLRLFKSAPVLRQALQIKHGTTQLYVLKLLKMQMRYLGKEWRRINLKTVSLIYSKVRHFLNDDWAFGNYSYTHPNNCQEEESALVASVDRFNNKRYKNYTKELVNDNYLSSVVDKPIDLTDNFKKHYEQWLEQEVFNNPIDWNKFLTESKSFQ